MYQCKTLQNISGVLVLFKDGNLELSHLLSLHMITLLGIIRVLHANHHRSAYRCDIACVSNEKHEGFHKDSLEEGPSPPNPLCGEVK
jgi:hypothetical protein